MYRFIVFWLQPFPLLGLLLVLGLVNLWRKRELSRRRLLLVTIPLVGLVVLFMPASGYLAQGTLEWLYPPQDAPAEGFQAIVVLAGYVRPPDDVLPQAELGHSTLDRCLHAARVYARSGPCPIVVTGGKVDPHTPGPPAAHTMRDFLLTQGVAPSDLLVEDRSRTTYENATETKKLLAERGIDRIVLVTTATHMFRADRCFRVQGFEVTPSGCTYESTHFDWSVFSFLPHPSAADKVQQAVHEWLGILWYWLHGRVS
ncbi:MAG: YdcF family protein [Pirellulales bacterium]|nr:YdcF family protein [Pirellulales bacterium]